MSEENKTELEIGGVKFTGGKMFAVITALSTLGGGAWGAFEFYNDYRNMKEQIANYVAPDLSSFQEQLSVMKKEMEKVKESVGEARDYTRDIKTDIKDDIARIEKVTDSTERKVKESEEKVRAIIEVANQRFDNKRDQLTMDNDRKIKDLEDRLNNRLQRALDNPLAK